MPEKSSRLLNDALLFAVSMKRGGSRLLMMAVGVWTAVLLLMMVGWWVGTAVADAASPQTTFTVTTNADTDDGSCDAHCTLREAMNTANNLPAPDVIVFDLPPLSQTITLNSQLPAITDSLTIDGSTVPSLTISGNNLYPIFENRPGVSTTLTYMNIISGFQAGGAAGINNVEGQLTLDHVSLRGNRATDLISFGGGIGSYRGSLFVYNSTFINNSAGQGGGIGSQYGSLIVSNSYFRGNVVNSLGGGILREGYTVPTIVSNTIFVDNTAAYGGGIFSGDRLTLTNSAFSYNSASVHGGGIFNAAEAVISHSTFSHNSASSFGGGMVNDAEAVISYTTFFSNTAGGSGGAVHNVNSLVLYASTFNGNSAGVYGGAIVNDGGAIITVTNSLFQRNVADYGGGIGDWSGNNKTIVSNSTFSSNTATISGGGIRNINILELNNVTLSDNEAPMGGGIASGGTMTMSNSLVANSVGGDCANSGLFNMNVHNLVEDGSCNPLVSGDPWLGPLADNGGATWTYALLPGSPAIDAGDVATCELTDQRGVVRPLDGNGDDTAVCDIGAVEQESAEPYKLFLPLLLKP